MNSVLEFGIGLLTSFLLTNGVLVAPYLMVANQLAKAYQPPGAIAFVLFVFWWVPVLAFVFVIGATIFVVRRSTMMAWGAFAYYPLAALAIYGFYHYKR
jgi:hypothetical protein